MPQGSTTTPNATTPMPDGSTSSPTMQDGTMGNPTDTTGNVTPPPPTTPKEYPLCSKTVQDSCMNPSEAPKGKKRRYFSGLAPSRCRRALQQSTAFSTSNTLTDTVSRRCVSMRIHVEGLQ